MKQVRVGVGVFIVRDDGSFLMCQRRGSHDADSWCPPGGHQEFGETWQQCAKREVKEETNIDIKENDVQFVGITNDIFNKEGKHYITIHAKVRWPGQAPKQMEPHRSSQWRWHKLNDLPQPLFLATANLIKTNPDLSI